MFLFYLSILIIMILNTLRFDLNFDFYKKKSVDINHDKSNDLNQSTLARADVPLLQTLSTWNACRS